jgi:hypothetical protein
MPKNTNPVTSLFVLATLLVSCNLFSPSGAGTDLFIAPADDTAVPEEARRYYRTDANVLTLREVRQSMPLTDAPVEIPDDKAESYYHALIHVYNSISAWSDTVTRVIPIHVFRDVELRQLIVSIEKDSTWTHAWRDGERLTGNPAIDELMNTWDLDLRSYHSWPFGHAVVLKANRDLNMHALIKKFELIGGVRYAEPNSWGGDGNNIHAEWSDPLTLKLTYSLGYGDCPAGCINRRFWEFEVSTTGEVQFSRAHGSPFPGTPIRW